MPLDLVRGLTSYFCKLVGDRAKPVGDRAELVGDRAKLVGDRAKLGEWLGGGAKLGFSWS